MGSLSHTVATMEYGSAMGIVFSTMVSALFIGNSGASFWSAGKDWHAVDKRIRMVGIKDGVTDFILSICRYLFFSFR
jgi:hypothetical protein